MGGMSGQDRWLTTEEASSQVGMSAEWVRQQIHKRRLKATVWQFGGRRTYRIREDNWMAFLSRHAQATDDPYWE
jgi:excisionase family DNA binding protein